MRTVILISIVIMNLFSIFGFAQSTTDKVKLNEN